MWDLQSTHKINNKVIKMLSPKSKLVPQTNTKLELLVRLQKRWPLGYISIHWQEGVAAHVSLSFTALLNRRDVAFSLIRCCSQSPHWSFIPPAPQPSSTTSAAGRLPADGTSVWVALRATRRPLFLLAEACHLSLLEVALRMILADSSSLPSGGPT